MSITTRDAIKAECQEDFKERLSDYIDEVEEQVVIAKSYLVDPTSLEEGMQIINDSNEILAEPARDLY